MQLLRQFKALGDETRLRLLALLLGQEMSVGELSGVLAVGQPGVSRHLRILAEAGLVTVRRDGQWAFYRTAQGPLLACLGPLVAAEASLAEDLARAEQVRSSRNREAAQRFDALAPQWDRLARDLLGGFDLPEALAGTLTTALAAPLGVVADLGCGPGEFLAHMAGVARQAIGVDQSPGMLAAARARLAGRENISLRMGQLEHLPLADGEADVAVLSLALRQVEDPSVVLAEAWRILRPGGCLLVAELDRHQREDLRATLGDRRLGVAEDELREWLAAAGFAAPEVRRIPLATGLGLLFCLARERGSRT